MGEGKKLGTNGGFVNKLLDRMYDGIYALEVDYTFRGTRIEELEAELGKAMAELEEKTQLIADLTERLEKLGLE